MGAPWAESVAQSGLDMLEGAEDMSALEMGLSSEPHGLQVTPMASFSLFEGPVPACSEEDLAPRLAALRRRLALALAHGEHRLGAAMQRLKEAEARPRGDEDRVDEINWLSPDVTGSGQPMRKAQANHSLTAAGFGGPWLPRRLRSGEAPHLGGPFE